MSLEARTKILEKMFKDGKIEEALYQQRVEQAMLADQGQSAVATERPATP